MRIVADHEQCIGSGQCAFAEPTIFDQGEDDGKVLLRRTQIPAELLDTVRHAVSSCPAQALRIEPA